MASGSGEITPADQGAVGGQEEDGSKVTFEDGKGDGKKKKFKPLERMFKFFKSGKKRSKSKERDPNIVSVKSKSTSALHKEIPHGGDDEEDGGFNRLPLGGTRSISEDSVFNPEQRGDPNLGGIRKGAVSMENIQQDFRPPPIGAKPNSQENQASSGGADQDEDDLFSTSWQEAVGGARSQRSNSTPAGTTSSDMDLNSVKIDTQILDSEAAKHKISIKPKSRRASSQRNRNKPSIGASALPQVKEESPPKEIPASKPQEEEKPSVVETKPVKDEVKVTLPKADEEAKVKVPESDSDRKDVNNEPIITVKDNKTSIQITGKDNVSEVRSDSPPVESDLGSPSKRRSVTESDKMPGLPVSPVALGAVKLRTRPRPKSLIEPPELPQDTGGNELAKAFHKRLSVRKEKTEEESIEDAIERKKDTTDITPGTLPSDGKKMSPVNSDGPSSTGITYVLKKEPLRKSSSSDSAKTPPLKSLSEEPKTEQQKPKQSDTKEQTKPVIDKKVVVPPAVQEKTKSLTNKLSSPREEYRLKRQSRSKTLPEQPVSQELLDKKLKETTAAENLSRSVTSKQEKQDTSEIRTDSVSSALSKKIEPKRLSLKNNTGTESNSSEPSWFALARRKQADSEENKDTTKKETSPPLSSSVGAKSTPVPGVTKTTSQPSTGAKTAPVQSAGGAKSNPTDSQNISSANKETTPSVRSIRDKMADKPDSVPTRASVKSSGSSSSKEEKEKINGNKKAPETKKEPEPVHRTLSNRSKFEPKSTTGGGQASSSTVPAWKANLAKKKDKEQQIKIEIIEKAVEKPVPPKKPPAKAIEEKVTLRDKPVVDKCSDKRQSKVLDMVKSFQKLEVS